MSHSFPTRRSSYLNLMNEGSGSLNISGGTGDRTGNGWSSGEDFSSSSSPIFIPSSQE